MYNILFVSALPGELKIIKEKVKELNLINLKTDFFTTWMWNYETIFSLTKYLENKVYDFVINIYNCNNILI